jgi:transposase
MSRDELEVLAREQVVRIAEQHVMTGRQIADHGDGGSDRYVMDRLEQTSEQLARLEHLLSRDSSNSNFLEGRHAWRDRHRPSRAARRRVAPQEGQAEGWSGSHLHWERSQMSRPCSAGGWASGTDLERAVDVGVVDRFPQHKVPLVTVTVTQCDQHAVTCEGSVRVYTAPPPRGGLHVCAGVCRSERPCAGVCRRGAGGLLEHHHR